MIARQFLFNFVLEAYKMDHLSGMHILVKENQDLLQIFGEAIESVLNIKRPYTISLCIF